MNFTVKNSFRPFETASAIGPNDKIKEIDGIKVLFYYDRSLRLWTCYAVDEMGNQIGETQYANRRNDDLPLAQQSAAQTLYAD